MLIVTNQFLILISGFKEIFIFAKLFKFLKLKSKFFLDLKTVKTTIMDINSSTYLHRNCNMLLVHERLTTKKIVI